MNFATSARAAEDRNGIVSSHLWCPNDLARLWDRLHFDFFSVYTLDRLFNVYRPL